MDQTSLSFLFFIITSLLESDVSVGSAMIPLGKGGQFSLPPLAAKYEKYILSF